MNNKVSRIMIISAINKGLYAPKSDLKRNIRNLTDLGVYFAKGRFQKDFFKLAQRILSNENSIYYELISNVFDNVDQNIIKTFGVNIGLNSWTYGVNKIREYEKKNNHRVPWTIEFDFQNTAENPMTASEITKVIEEGKEIGIYTYFFFTRYKTSNLDSFLQIFRENPECAFIIHAHAESINKIHAQRLREYGNAVISIYVDDSNPSPQLTKAMKMLLENKCLFGASIVYDDDNINFIVNHKWIEEIKKLNCIFAFLIKSEKCSLESEKAVNVYVKNAKTNQIYPLFLIDFYEDISYISQIISDKSCFLKIFHDGTVVSTEYDMISDFNIKYENLSTILSQIMPKASCL